MTLDVQDLATEHSLYSVREMGGGGRREKGGKKLYTVSQCVMCLHCARTIIMAVDFRVVPHGV